MGGAGSLGGVVLPLLAASPGLDLMVVADRDLDVCEDRISGFVGTVAETVDAESTESIAHLVDRHRIELIVNVAGPYSLTLMPVLQAAVELGANYVDVADGATETGQGLTLDAKAKESGAVCLLGMGMYPGLTNILAVHAANHLESFSTVAVAEAVAAAAIVPDQATIASMRRTGRIGAGWRSLIEAASRPAHVWREGRPSSAPAGTVQDSTTPMGYQASLALHDHSEPTTLPRYMPTITEAATYLGFVPREADSLFRHAAQSVADGEGSAAEAVIEFFERVDARREQLAAPTGFPIAEVWAEVEGILEGRPVRVTSWAIGPPTTTPILAAAVKGISSGQVNSPGVNTAEALSNQMFLSLIADQIGTNVNTLIDQRVTPLD